MPASPIANKITLPDNWVQLQKTMTPDQATGCYWSVWYDWDEPIKDKKKGTAWLMWCAIGEDPSVNDSWCHAEEINGDCRNVLDVIKSVYGVSFHESIWKEISPEQTVKDNPIVDGIEEYCSGAPHIESCPLYKPIIPSGPVAIGRGETWDGE